MVAALALMNVSENCLALFWHYAALVNTSDTAPDQLSVDYGVSYCSLLHLSGRDLISWQLFVHQELEDWLSPGWCCYFFDCQDCDLDEGRWTGRRRVE